LILTDDQPATMLDPLPNLQMDLVGDRGVTFGHALVTTPLCAPSRASILTGRYANQHGIFTNFLPNGFFALDDSSTVATWLHDAGYRTGLFGKYINGYGGQVPPNHTGTTPYRPPGWDEWHALRELAFYDYYTIDNEIGTPHGATPADYSTDVLAAEAVDFIRSSGTQPFLLYFAPYAPHEPATPAPRLAGSYAGVPPWRPPSYDEADVSDKAKWLRENTPPLTAEEVAYADALYPKMLESLRAVDDAIAAIMAALREMGRDEDTLVVFTSDNGFALGEHRRMGKLCGYEECTRVPMVIRYPRLDAAPHVDSRIVANIDLAPTFAELAGATPASAVDGTSLLPLLDGSAQTWRTDILFEMPLGGDVAPFSAVASDRWSYVEYKLIPPLLGEEAELFDLDTDPYELMSVDGDPAHHDVQAALAARLRELKPSWMQPVP
jgi:N-acetylglucosamine-6-sulfatase